MTRFLVVPQWQGSSSSRAMQLVDGATAIAGDLPRSACVSVEVPMEAGESLDSGVHRLSALQRVAALQLQALSEMGAHDIDADAVLTIGGDAGVATTAALAATGAAQGALEPGTAVVWFSAHAGFHDPGTSPGGAYDTMALRALVDAAAPRAAEVSIAAHRVVLAGVRDIHPAEQAAIDRLGIRVVFADAFTPRALVEAVGDATGLFLHVGLDVLDPAAMSGISSPEPFGPDVAALTAAIAALREVAALRGAAVTEFSPPSPAEAINDLGAILRIVGALT